jgi:hypothetical protein
MLIFWPKGTEITFDLSFSKLGLFSNSPLVLYIVLIGISCGEELAGINIAGVVVD